MGADDYFNADQRDHMEALNRIPDDERCWCAWYSLKECAAGLGTCSIGKAPIAPLSLADRRPLMCPDVRCRAYPHRPGEAVTHTVGCRALAPPAPVGKGE